MEESKNQTNLVVSRYNKNVDFVYNINNNNNINVMIYDKENPNNILNVPVNKGNEASVYLHLFSFQTPILLGKKIRKKCKINNRNFTYDGLTFSCSSFVMEQVKDEI
uniref:Uncharacterized protein n=1 Tax=viral metagenome TaxID=1070528 RepID=A0A6C0EUF7_9ZZZZ